jgi:hypothetical protein
MRAGLCVVYKMTQWQVAAQRILHLYLGARFQAWRWLQLA